MAKSTKAADGQLDLGGSPAPKGLKIISLQAENLKRLTAVRIDPRGNLVEIRGRNAQGKSSVLDAIWWALAGAGNIQADPIRKGQERAVVKLDLGDLIVTRTFTKQEDGSFRTSIAVENGEGARYPSPQRMLDELLGSLTFDPLAFARMKPKEQFDALKGFVPGIDFANIEGLNRADFEKRTAINRRVKELNAQAQAIAIPEALPTERVDDSALVAEIADVGNFNAQIDLRADRRTQVANSIKGLLADAQQNREEITELQAKIDHLQKEISDYDRAREELEKKLADAPPLEEKKDAAEVTRRLEEAKRTNALIDQATRRTQLQEQAKAAQAEADALTARIEARDKAKVEAIAAAKLPIDGLGFGDEAITLYGLPFEQASDAERLRASCAIAMASNPKLRVIRVRDGSLLDEDGMRLLGEMADAHDCQVWVEAVDSSGRVGIVLEDGHVASTPESRAAMAQAAE
ncbi:MAG: hypothetical protein FD144_2617 [Rhodospirillaceae bacterium]|nr:MAG: hypothetical protein FD144_2617 [Rhodospirillaceae bacterium]